MTATSPKRRTLSSILVDCEIVTPEQVNHAVRRQLETGRLIGETLVELGFTTEENIGWALSKQLGIPYVDVQTGAVDLELVRRFPESLLRRVQAAPLFRSQEEIVIAITDPTDPEAVLELEAASGMNVSLVIGCPASIRRVLDTVYGPSRTPAPTVPPPTPGPGAAGPGAGEGALPAGPRVVWERSGATFLLYHVHEARASRASEVHFVPTPAGLSVSYRTDQGVEPRALEAAEAALYLRTRLAHLGAPDLAPEGPPAAFGSATVTVGGDRVHVGVCHCRSDSGITTVLRMFPDTHQAPDLSTLGVSPIGEAEIRDFVEGPEGLVIVHGPPRSGGSTLLASLAALATRPERRTVVFEPWRVAPYAPGTTRVQVPAGSGAESGWERIAIGLGADVVVLDEVLLGSAMEGVLAGATVGRLVFARTDWLDGRALLSFLARGPNARAALRDRPFAMITLPTARREGSGVWATPAEAESHAGLLEATILTEETRDTLFGSEEP